MTIAKKVSGAPRDLLRKFTFPKVSSIKKALVPFTSGVLTKKKVLDSFQMILLRPSIHFRCRLRKTSDSFRFYFLQTFPFPGKLRSYCRNSLRNLSVSCKYQFLSHRSKVADTRKTAASRYTPGIWYVSQKTLLRITLKCVVGSKETLGAEVHKTCYVYALKTHCAVSRKYITKKKRNVLRFWNTLQGQPEKLWTHPPKQAVGPTDTRSEELLKYAACTSRHAAGTSKTRCEFSLDTSTTNHRSQRPKPMKKWVWPKHHPASPPTFIPAGGWKGRRIRNASGEQLERTWRTSTMGLEGTRSGNVLPWLFAKVDD